jgi:hypothetical protein
MNYALRFNPDPLGLALFILVRSRAWFYKTVYAAQVWSTFFTLPISSYPSHLLLLTRSHVGYVLVT